MKIVSVAALLALANFASAGQVSNDLSNENVRDADAVLKEHAKIDAASERAAAAADIGEECEAKTEVLSTCFEINNEPDGAACWEDCVAPAAEAFDTCDGFCNSVELCRRVKCSSGPACASNYYDVLNCVLKDDEGAGDCACTGSLDLEETPAVTEAADVVPSVEEEAVMMLEEDGCMDQTMDLLKCFTDAKETDGPDCWEDCTLTAEENTDSCESFCAAVETCRAERCSSGPACAGSYYDVLNCVMGAPGTDEKCTCGGGAVEADATAEGSCAAGDAAETCAEA